MNWKCIVTSKEFPLSVHNAKFMWEIYKGNSGPSSMRELGMDWRITTRGFEKWTLFKQVALKFKQTCPH